MRWKGSALRCWFEASPGWKCKSVLLGSCSEGSWLHSGSCSLENKNHHSDRVCCRREELKKLGLLLLVVTHVDASVEQSYLYRAICFKANLTSTDLMKPAPYTILKTEWLALEEQGWFSLCATLLHWCGETSRETTSTAKPFSHWQLNVNFSIITVLLKIFEQCQTRRCTVGWAESGRFTKFLEGLQRLITVK